MATVALHRLADWLANEGKSVAKSVYRRPVIGAARLWRHALNGTQFIGVTGSAGKTTTKDLLHAMLVSQAPSAKSLDSNNQLYSVARSLLATSPRQRYCVQELGASEPGGLDPMLELLRPCVGIVTVVGTDHFKSFRSLQAVAHEKCRLISALPPDGLAILNADDPFVAAMAASSAAKVITFGMKQAADFQGAVLAANWPDRLRLRISHAGNSVEVATQFCGAHQSVVVLAAIAAACSLGVPLQAAADVAALFKPMLGRMSVHSTARGVTFIRDDWKAPLWSMPAALGFMSEAEAARKFIVVGTVSDAQGKRSPKYTRVLQAALAAADHVIGIGNWTASVTRRLPPPEAPRFHGFGTVQEASVWFWKIARPGDLVLLKGSLAADHLGRIALAAEWHVECWRQRCGRIIFCENCRLVGSPEAARSRRDTD